MALPRKLKHLNLFNDGNNWQGIVESLTLPKFTRKYEKYRGGGMPGAVDVDLGLDDSALDTEFSIGGTELLLFKQMGKATVDGIQLRFTGSIQRDDTGEVQAVELVVRGRHKEVDSGEWKTGESNTTKVTSTNSYAKRSRAITWWVRMKTCWYLIAPMPIGVTPNGQRKCSGNACNAVLRHSRYNWRKGGQISTRKCQ